MEENKYKHQNRLLLYRRRMGFSQKHVATLLGHKDTAMVCRYETGSSLPPLLTALKLEIIYRVPVAFIYGGIYDAMREKIRKQEETLAAPTQAVLF
jgi:transcriptional regulator with XRE-family HTH domain